MKNDHGYMAVIYLSVALAVMGGLGSVHGAILAGIIIGVIETTSGFFISPALKQASYFAAFILVLVISPAGLFVSRGAETDWISITRLISACHL